MIVANAIDDDGCVWHASSPVRESWVFVSRTRRSRHKEEELTSPAATAAAAADSDLLAAGKEELSEQAAKRAEVAKSLRAFKTRNFIP
uniref:Uncharacterized protein n=1 Tax=Oryza meridionalis TaxID=40149 RepID=A0A0E0DXX8_9ORYZ